jgi:NAD-dependent dihydropyrimidine dehydrogenase PreA subunit
MKVIPVDNCKDEPGILMPVVNFNSCEGKGPCIDVCPYDVFEMQPISDDQYKELSFIGKLKTRVHGREKAVVVNADLCHSCGLCVMACPEKAIKLTRVNN